MKKVKEYFAKNTPSIKLMKKVLDRHFENPTVESIKYVIMCGNLLFNLKQYIPKRPVKRLTKNTRNEFVFIEFIEMFNLATGKNYKGDSKTERQFNARVKDYGKDDFIMAISNANEHLGNDYIHYLTPEYITRENKFNTWLNYSAENKNDSDFNNSEN